MEKVRIDKWLWSVRIFKSRTIASDACRTGKVKIDGVPVKPSHLLMESQEVEVRKEGFNFVFRVEKLIDKRVSAILAKECYSDLTPEEELMKYENWFVGKASPEKRSRGTGRPTKKQRREIDQFKDDQF